MSFSAIVISEEGNPKSELGSREDLTPKKFFNVANKFKKHDLIGIPFQIILGSKSTENNFEFKEVGKDSELLKIDEIKSRIKE